MLGPRSRPTSPPPRPLPPLTPVCLPRLQVGRQFFVVFVVFLCAQLTTYADMPQGSIPDWLWTLVIETGCARGASARHRAPRRTVPLHARGRCRDPALPLVLTVISLRRTRACARSLPGALVVLAFGQLIPQLVAATHPVALMNLRGTWSVSSTRPPPPSADDIV